MQLVPNPIELLKLAIAKYGSLSAVSRQIKTNRSILKKIKNGTTKNPHAKTVGKLVKAVEK